MKNGKRTLSCCNTRNRKKARTAYAETLNAWRTFSRQVFADGALPAKTKELIAIAVAHVTQCPYCIRAHTKSALCQGRD